MKVTLKKGFVMRHPVWLLNGILLVFLLLTLIILFIFRPHMPKIQSFLPSAEIKPFHKEIPKIDLSKIYTNDLFDTYRAAVHPKPETAPAQKPMPQPPAAITTTKPAIPAPKFLEPLKIQVRGIIIGSNEQHNVAIIEDLKDKRSKNYHIGDILEDAQLIRILKNKIILIRANGQQETLYVNQHDAELELLLTPANWNAVIKKLNDKNYAIDPDLFAERIKSLAQLIDQLNITTVYHQGKSVGCRIGKLDSSSIGYALGLQPGDIVEFVNTISTTTTQLRLQIYQEIINTPLDGTITIQLVRKGAPLTLNYILRKTDIPQPERPITVAPVKTPQEVEEEKMRLLRERERFAPTAQEIRKREKENILQLMERNGQAKRNVLTESIKP